MTIAFYPELVPVAGDIRTAVVLCQIIYWFKPSERTGLTKLTVRRGSVPCLAKSHEDLASETGLTPRQVKTAISKLRARRLIQTEQHLFGGLNVNHITLDAQRLSPFLSGKRGERRARPGAVRETAVQPGSPESPNQADLSGLHGRTAGVRSYTEITSETTAETTAVALRAEAGTSPEATASSEEETTRGETPRVSSVQGSACGNRVQSAPSSQPDAAEVARG